MVNELDNFLENYTGTKASVEERFMTRGTIELASPICKGKDVLQMGLGNGMIAKYLDKIVLKQTIIEGSSKILEKFSFKSNKTDFINTFFENYKSENKYDVILANHVLEHVDSPSKVLNYIKLFLKDEGKVFITVPNANSLHRLIGVEMGLLSNKYQLNSSDIKAGHQRVYDFKSLKDDIKKAGLRIRDSGGYNLKMVSLSQMKDWPQQLLDAVFTISQSMPKEICSNLWVICKNNGDNI